jgi:hypothetical protein
MDDVLYYDVVKNWSRKLKPHLADPEFNRRLVRDFNRFSTGRNGTPFTAGMLPYAIDTTDWRVAQPRRGRAPQYWDYVCLKASYWFANSLLRLAELAEPRRPWRIRTGGGHSTVWDGEETLFDFYWLALDIPASESFAMSSGRALKPGRQLRTYPAVPKFWEWLIEDYQKGLNIEPMIEWGISTEWGYNQLLDLLGIDPNTTKLFSDDSASVKGAANKLAKYFILCAERGRLDMWL